MASILLIEALILQMMRNRSKYPIFLGQSFKTEQSSALGRVMAAVCLVDELQ